MTKLNFMRKVILTLCFFSLLSKGFSQDDFAHSEVKFNIANTIAIATVEVGYEYFIDYNQSIDVQVHFNDRINYHTEKGSREFNTMSFQLGYNFYLTGDPQGSGIHISPFVKYRTGDFTEIEVISNEPIEIEEEVTTDMSGFIVGIGAGYKFNFGNQFVFGPFVNVARNFNEEVKDRFTAIEFNGGISIGYRF